MKHNRWTNNKYKSHYHGKLVVSCSCTIRKPQSTFSLTLLQSLEHHVSSFRVGWVVAFCQWWKQCRQQQGWGENVGCGWTSWYDTSICHRFTCHSCSTYYYRTNKSLLLSILARYKRYVSLDKRIRTFTATPICMQMYTITATWKWQTAINFNAQIYHC